MRREFQHHPRLAAALVFGVGLRDNRQDVAPEPEGGFYHVRNEFFVRRRIEVAEVRRALLNMVREVEVGSVRKPADLVELMRVAKMKISGAFGIMRPFSIGDFDFFDVFRRKAERVEPLLHFDAPILKMFLPLSFGGEIFEFHYLKLPHAEDKIARSDFVAERTAYLSDAEGQFRMIGVDDVLEVDEHALRRLRPEINSVTVIIM